MIKRTRINRGDIVRHSVTKEVVLVLDNNRMELEVLVLIPDEEDFYCEGDNVLTNGELCEKIILNSRLKSVVLDFLEGLEVRANWLELVRAFSK